MPSSWEVVVGLYRRGGGEGVIRWDRAPDVRELPRHDRDDGGVPVREGARRRRRAVATSVRLMAKERRTTLLTTTSVHLKHPAKLLLLVLN